VTQRPACGYESTDPCFFETFWYGYEHGDNSEYVTEVHMATRKGITPDQLKQASSSLGLTVAVIAEGSGLSKAYVSEFRSGARSLKGPQQAQLRAYLEERCEQAGVDFPEDEDQGDDAPSAKMVQQLGGLVMQVSRPALLLSDDVTKAQREQLLNLIEANRLKVAELLAAEFKTGGGLLGGEFSEATADALRQTFGLLALNYLAVALLQGRSIVKLVPKDAQPQTMGDWLSQYLADSPLGELLPADAEEPALAEGDDE